MVARETTGFNFTDGKNTAFFRREEGEWQRLTPLTPRGSGGPSAWIHVGDDWLLVSMLETIYKLTNNLEMTP